MKQEHAQNPKRPLLPEELVTSKPPFTAAFYTLPTYCSALQRSCQKERGRKVQKRQEGRKQPCQEPVTEMQKAKPGLLVTSVTRWFIQTAPFPRLLLASTASPPSAIWLIVTALQHLRQAGSAFTRRWLLNFKVVYKGFNFSLREKLYFQICHCSWSSVSFTVKKHTDTSCSGLKQEPTTRIYVLTEALVEQRHLEIFPQVCILGNLHLITMSHYSFSRKRKHY